jgi:intracellular sulfur oxidation DsrE/DsrF family protein
MKKTIRHLACSLLIALCLGEGAVQAAQQQAAYNDAAALKGVTQGKGIFMVSLDNPQKMALYLKVIAGTHDNFTRQGVAPDLKVVFIGASVRHLTRTAAGSHGGELARQIDQLQTKGVRLEICAIATELFGIDNADLLKPLHVINDGFISAIGYQSQGYQLVPIY